MADYKPEVQNSAPVFAPQKLSVGGWFGSIFLLAIPVVGLIMLFVWAFGKDDDRKNFARAQLIWMLIGVVVSIVVTVVASAWVVSMLESFSSGF